MYSSRINWSWWSGNANTYVTSAAGAPWGGGAVGWRYNAFSFATLLVQEKAGITTLCAPSDDPARPKLCGLDNQSTIYVAVNDLNEDAGYSDNQGPEGAGDPFGGFVHIKFQTKLRPSNKNGAPIVTGVHEKSWRNVLTGTRRVKVHPNSLSGDFYVCLPSNRTAGDATVVLAPVGATSWGDYSLALTKASVSASYSEHDCADDADPVKKDGTLFKVHYEFAGTGNFVVTEIAYAIFGPTLGASIYPYVETSTSQHLTDFCSTHPSSGCTLKGYYMAIGECKTTEKTPRIAVSVSCELDQMLGNTRLVQTRLTGHQSVCVWTMPRHAAARVRGVVKTLCNLPP